MVCIFVAFRSDFFLQIPINLVNSNVYAYFDLTMNFAKSEAGSMVPLF